MVDRVEFSPPGSPNPNSGALFVQREARRGLAASAGAPVSSASLPAVPSTDGASESARPERIGAASADQKPPVQAGRDTGPDLVDIQNQIRDVMGGYIKEEVRPLAREAGPKASLPAPSGSSAGPSSPDSGPSSPDATGPSAPAAQGSPPEAGTGSPSGGLPAPNAGADASAAGRASSAGASPLAPLGEIGGANAPERPAPRPEPALGGARGAIINNVA